MFLAAAGVSTFVLSIALTIGVRRLAHRIGMVAAPTQNRWHKTPTALLGGAAIFTAFIAGFLVFGDRANSLYPIVGGGAFLFLVGLVDDAVQLKPYTKLVAQLIAASAVVYFGHTLPWTSSQPLNDIITIFWLIGITNAINLLDNMDGLAGGIT